MFNDKDRLFRHSFLLMSATQAGNLANLLFQAVMGRALPTAEYGALAAMLGIALIVTTPMDAIRAAMAQFASRLTRQGRPDAIPAMAREWTLKMLPAAAAATAAGFLFNRRLSAFFQVETSWLMPLAGASVGLSLLFPLFIGVLQGMQSFVRMSITAHSYSVLRLIAGAAAVMLAARTAAAALLGQIIGMAGCILLGWFFVRRPAAGAPQHARAAEGVPAYFLKALAALGLFAVIMNADIVLAKRFFPPLTAGRWAMAATIARTVVFLPMPIAMALFPKVTSWGDKRMSGLVTLAKALGLTALVICGAAAACAWLPWLPYAVIYGIREPDPELVRLLRLALLAMSPLGLVYILLNFELAQNRFAAAMSLAVPTLFYVAAVVLRHETLSALASALGASAAAALVLLVCALAWSFRRRNRENAIKTETQLPVP